MLGLSLQTCSSPLLCFPISVSSTIIQTRNLNVISPSLPSSNQQQIQIYIKSIISSLSPVTIVQITIISGLKYCDSLLNDSSASFHLYLKLFTTDYRLVREIFQNISQIILLPHLKFTSVSGLQRASLWLPFLQSARGNCFLKGSGINTQVRPTQLTVDLNYISKNSFTAISRWGFDWTTRVHTRGQESWGSILELCLHSDQ